MQHPSGLSARAVAANLESMAILRQAAAAGRETLISAELGTLLSSLDVQFDAGATSATGSPGVELRIGLHNSREFGTVISAGLGGLDAGLAEGNLRPYRSSVHAAAGLTDATDVLELFRRTFAWRKHGADTG